ncbi:2-C-methyl-D-erythritol 4-phosphate cytidylyltransferase [Actinophytocola gossypii]|uniref:2-C-methyl-D-erythritol 4-phosphate cytidylyltransferase n=1 Tax=Actinophytocola gossypii TaxID=2812003 RepID=A0ABT2J3Z1_9PSEU|nr:2-C-methyl-D-erythritol 4-phosphate cytidylyltransferase [Actinophytocola gossypii]MCT2582576.1 2-C-methyl-D-erythritol 4-phosphate cytidylyltransferase [Actinophytocola gossypii]
MTSAVALVPAAGRGERLGDKGPKALVPVHGVPLVVRAVRGLLSAGCVRRVVVAAPATALDTMRTVLADAGADALVVPGGADRTESVRLALDAALGESRDVEIVLVHDAARAFTPPELVRAVVAEVAGGSPAVVPVLPVADTVKRVDADGVVTGTVDRADLRAVQTPQGFQVDVLRRCYAAAAGQATDDAGLAERIGVPVSTVPGHPAAMKITTPFDLHVAEALFGVRA